MPNKQWYTFYVTTRRGMDRYLLEGDPVPEFESQNQYLKWCNAMRAYFRARTAIRGGQIVAIEPSDIADVYEYQPTEEQS